MGYNANDLTFKELEERNDKYVLFGKGEKKNLRIKNLSFFPLKQKKLVLDRYVP